MMLHDLSWIFIMFALYGAYLANTKPALPKYNRLLVMSLAYSVANVWNIFYFLITMQWPYLLLNCVFMVMSAYGIYAHGYKNRKENARVWRN